MSTYVLVHGAWHGSWCWSRVRRALQAQGHDVFTPTLTGIGERSHLLSPAVDLETHISDVVSLIRWEELSDVILCGHSYGGCVARGVADRIPQHIAALVYLDAFVPDNGHCLHDTLPAEARDAQMEAALASGDGWKIPPIPAEVFNVNAQDRDWVDRQCTLQPAATFQQPLRLTGAADKIGNITFILASNWAPSPFPPFYDKAIRNGWKTHTIACGHDVMLDRPDELSNILLELSAQA